MSLPSVFLDRPITHRGLHDVADGRPENSIEAIKAAVAAGYGIEIDLQLSSDGVPMVFHDYDLARLTDQMGAVAQRTASDLSAIALKGGVAGIPTLTEVLQIVDGAVPLLIEIKDQDGAMGPNVGPLERATIAALAGYDGPVAIMSFNPNAIAIFHTEAAHIPRGLVTSAYIPENWAPVPADVCDTLRGIPDYDRVGATFISHEAADLHRLRVAALKAVGATILCWTIKSAAQEVAARDVAQNVTFEGYLA